MIINSIKNLNGVKLSRNLAFLAFSCFFIFNCSKNKSNNNGKDVPSGGEKDAKYVLSITEPKHGTIISNAGSINCGSNGNVCKVQLGKDSRVTLTAQADHGYLLGAWGGDDCTDSGKTCTLSMDKNKAVTKTFSIIQRTLNVDKPDGGRITSSTGGINCGSGVSETACSATFAHGTSVILTATATTNYEPGAW